MSLTNTLIDFVVGTEYRTLPRSAVSGARKLCLDTVGVALAGSGAAGVEPTVRLIREWGGKEESTIWVYGHKVPSPHACLVNAVMSHALDFDDTHAETAVHAGASVIPTALAMAESVGKVSGEAFIAAIVTGVEVASKFGLSLLEQDRGWHLSATLGTFASAAVAGKLLGLDRHKMANALGIGFTQAAGSLQSVIDSSLAKRMQLGFCARSGIFAALLAKEGVTGPEHFLEGPYGFFKLYHSDRYNPKVLTENLGLPFEIVNLAIKPYPCCRLAHSPLDALFDLLKESDLHLDGIEAIDVYGSQAMKTLCGKPFHVGKNSEIDAQFSLAYIMVSAMTRRVVDINSFSRKAVEDPVLSPHTQKVNVIASPNITNRFACRIEIKTKDGRVFSKSVDAPKGQPENPMTWEECVDKFKRCSVFGAKRLDPTRLEKFIQTVGRLETTESVADLVPFLI